jgi:hypothetical protein
MLDRDPVFSALTYFALALALVTIIAGACSGCGERVVYVYPDGPNPTADAGPPTGDGAVLPDVDAAEPPVDAPALPAGTCLPHRTDIEVSSADCHRYAATPVCDGLAADPVTGLSTCAPEPTGYCGACETDDQCHTGVDLRSECVLIPYRGEVAGTPFDRTDQACLSPCATDDDCAFLPRPEWSGVRCLPLPRGTYCVVPFTDGTPTCSDFSGGRRG